MKKFLVLAALTVALIATPAMATEGLYLGAFLPYDKISGDLHGYDNGWGLGGRVGYGFNRYLALEGSIFKTTHDVSGGGTADFKGATVDLKLSLPLTGSKLSPYLLVGVGGYRLETDAGNFKGGGGQVGLGLDISFFPELSFNVGYTKRSITFDSNSSGLASKVDADVRMIDIGLTYHFL